MTTLSLRAAFFHVIDAHRWLAASGCAWNLVGAEAVNASKSKAHRLVPNIDVMVRDTLLVHARSLIDFYTKQYQAGSTDILLCDFGLSLDQQRSRELTKYKHPIEVHLFHLTDFRDLDYRALHNAGKDATRYRPDWNHKAITIVNSIFNALKDVSDAQSGWKKPFRDLDVASTARYRDKSYIWPKNLCEKADVRQYLKSLGL